MPFSHNVLLTRKSQWGGKRLELSHNTHDSLVIGLDLEDNRLFNLERLDPVVYSVDVSLVSNKVSYG